MSLDARQVELRNRTADVQTAENLVKDYEQQIRDLHVPPPPLCRAPRS